MRFSARRVDPTNLGEQTVPMEAIAGPSVPHSPVRPRLPFLQSTYYLVATLGLVCGILGALAMHFGWFDMGALLEGGKGSTSSTSTMHTPMSLPHPLAPPLLAQDLFARPNQLLWGSASDGLVWGGDANSNPAFAIRGGVGTIAGGAGFFTALLGPNQAGVEEEVAASLSRFDGGRTNMGEVLRYSGGNYYKAYLDGAQLILMKRVGGNITTLSAVPFTARDGVSYSIRFRARGTQLLAKAWPTGTAEPVSWMVAASDGSLAQGVGGLRVLLEQGTVASVSAVSERVS